MSAVPAFFYRQSGVIPLRRVGTARQILLITSSNGKRWIIPKGVVEPELSARESAAKEAYEEAGVIGRLSEDPVGAYEYEKWGGICRVEVFLCDVERLLDDWPEANVRDRRWLSLVEAADELREPYLKNLLAEMATESPGS